MSLAGARIIHPAGLSSSFVNLSSGAAAARRHTFTDPTRCKVCLRHCGDNGGLVTLANAIVSLAVDEDAAGVGATIVWRLAPNDVVVLEFPGATYVSLSAGDDTIRVIVNECE